MPLEIRPVQSPDEYRAVEQLQRDVWHLDDAEIVPDHLLLTAQKNGGLVLGAFECEAGQARERLVGFVFGFLGLTSQGGLKHCSHMTGVAPDWQGRGLGYRLKLAQREFVLSQGIELITWTFDPLEGRNAALNFRKLGVTCNTYLQDLYGSMRDGLNVGLPSDRFQVDWRIASSTVVERLQGGDPGPTMAELRAMGCLVLNAQGPDRPAAEPSGPRALISIPADFQAIKAADMALARGWRLHTRQLFRSLFSYGYQAVDLIRGSGEVCYLLEEANRTLMVPPGR